MKKLLLPVLLLVLLVSCKEDEPALECPQREIELKVMNRAADELGVSIIIPSPCSGSFFGDYRGGTGFIAPQEDNISVHKLIADESSLFIVQVASRDQANLDCCMITKNIIDYDEQVVLLLTFDGTNYKAEFL